MGARAAEAAEVFWVMVVSSLRVKRVQEAFA
jgi:hypothetical protein